MPRRYSGSSRSRFRSITRLLPDLRRAASRPTRPRSSTPCPRPCAARRRPPAGRPTGYEPRNFTSACFATRLRSASANDLVGDVAFAVDEEAVVAEPALGRPRLELREVDRRGPRTPAGSAAANRAGPRAGSRRSTSCRGPSARERPGPTSTKRVWFSGWSSISLAEHLQPVDLGRERVADRGHVGALRLRDLARRVGGGVRGPRLGRRAASARASRGTARSRAGTTRRSGCRRAPTPGRTHRFERDRQVDLALDQQVAVERERVERDRHRPLDHVLDRHDTAVGIAPLDRRDHLGHGRERRRDRPRRGRAASAAPLR